MKYIIYTIALFSISIASAQTLDYTDDFISYDDQNIQAVAATLEPDVSTIKNKFEDWMNDNYNVDLDGKKLLFFNKDVMTAENVMIPQVSDRLLQLNVKVDETHRGKTRLYVFAKKSDGVYISEKTDQSAFAGLKGVVHEFIADYLPEYYMDQIEETEEVLDDLADNKQDMENEIRENENDIRDLQSENIKLKRKVEATREDIKETEEDLQIRNKEIKKVKNKIVKEDKK